MPLEGQFEQYENAVYLKKADGTHSFYHSGNDG